jgi:UDP-N-acetylmuramate dehydrogenase
MTEILDFFREHNISVSEFESLKEHCTFGIGGTARAIVKPHCEEDIALVLASCRQREIPVFILGNGSNILFSDEGFSGIILTLKDNWSDFTIDGCLVTAKSGVSLATLARKTAMRSLTGMEFATGIPGTLGGGVIMNAGAYEGELAQIVRSVRVMDRQGRIFAITGEEMEFGYRTSRAQREFLIILEVVLELQWGEYERIWRRIDELTIRRWMRQPLEFPSAGSTFKRPPGHYAGKLIEDAGLKGLRFRGAMVSSKHSGFVVNVDGASASDVRTLIRIVQKRVLDEYGILLQPEVRMIGATGET